MGANSVKEYYQKANDFIDGQSQFIRGRYGDKQYFDPATNIFAVTDSEGVIKTYKQLEQGDERIGNFTRALNKMK